MIPQRLLMFAFVGMVIVQLGLPLRTVFRHEWTARYGEVFKFDTRPYDPNDPFRGKYVALAFERLENELSSEKLAALGPNIQYGQKLYFVVEKDEVGIARAVDLLAEKPNRRAHYFPTKVKYAGYQEGILTHIELQYPFEYFFLEETKAPRADERYHEATRRDSLDTYAIVKLHQGIVVLDDVTIDGKSLRAD